MAEWIDVVAAAALPDGWRRLLRRAGHESALLRVDGDCDAIADSFPHAAASLVTGKRDGTTVTCRAHGLRLDLATGGMRSAAGLAVRSCPVRVHEGRGEVDPEPAA
jgi:3-phenylpropionate/trans-cinnamate dioxygenase ferredoxin subunit